MNKSVLKLLLDKLIKKDCYLLMSLLFLFLIKERTQNGKNKALYSKKNGRITILALDSERYRGDLEALASEPTFQVLCIKQKWQGALIRALYLYNPPTILYRSTNVIRDSTIDNTQKFMNGFLKRLYSIIKVDCITNINYRYIEDFDWTLASKKMGIPYIMLYRECLLNVDRIKYDVQKRHKSLGKFHGTKIIVHNDICKSLFVNSGYCESSKIKVCGALRMDSFVNYINRHDTVGEVRKIRKKFVLFYFPYSLSLFGKDSKCDDNEYKYKYAFNIWAGREKLFRDLHNSILKMAKLNPDIDFVIKPKRTMMKSKSWKFYEKVISESGVDISKLDNYKIEPNADVHKLIIESDVICALQSSTVIESALAGKKVIFPLFNGYTETDNFMDFGWKDNLELFEVARDAHEFESTVLECFKDPVTPEGIRQERTKLFIKYFNSIKGKSIDCYTDEIGKTINF
jgi:hypothetical protein